MNNCENTFLKFGFSAGCVEVRAKTKTRFAVYHHTVRFRSLVLGTFVTSGGRGPESMRDVATKREYCCLQHAGIELMFDKVYDMIKPQVTSE